MILYDNTVSSIVFQDIVCSILQQSFRDFSTAWSLLQIHSVLTGQQDISRGWLKTRNNKKPFPSSRLKLSWNTDFLLDAKELLII